jgi:hypothetical protein
VQHEEEDERRSLFPGSFSISFPHICKEWQSRMFLPERDEIKISRCKKDYNLK